VEGIGTGDLAGRDEGGDGKVGAAGIRWPNAYGLGSFPDMEGLPLRLRVHSHGKEALLPAGLQNPEGNFSAVGDEDLFHPL
jgi:hypothetical protein